MEKIKLSNSSRSIIDLFSGSAISNLIGIGLIWFYTAFFSSGVVGQFFVFNAIALVASVVTTLQAPVSIVLALDERMMWRNFSASVYINLLISFALFACMLLVKSLGVEFINEYLSAYHLMLVPVCAFAMGMAVIFENVLTYYQRYKVISYSRVVKMVVMAAVQLSFLWFTDNAVGLIVGLVVAQLGAVLFMAFAGNMVMPAKSWHLSRDLFKGFYRDNKEILHYNALINIILSASNQLPVVAISFFFGSNVAGVFGLAHRIIAIPLGVISQSFSQVFFKDASRRYNNGSMLGVLSLDNGAKLFGLLSATAVIIVLFMQLFINHLGAQWVDAAVYVMVISPWLVGQCLILPFTNLFSVFRIQRRILPLYVIQFVSRILVFAVPLLFVIPFIQLLILFVVTSFIYYLYYLYFIFRKIQSYDRSVLSQYPVAYNQLLPLVEGSVKWLMGRKEMALFRCLPWCSNMVAENGITTLIFQKGQYGPQIGSQFVNYLKIKREQVVLSYRVRFSNNFDFAKGGKLPGLAGGEVVGGGENHKLQAGWSARFMFMEGGTLCLYLYHPLKDEVFGEQHYLKLNKQLFMIERNEWIHIRQEVIVNDVQKANGRIRVWIENVLALDLNNLVLRCCEDVKVDNVLFSCFFGGDDESYAPKNTCSVSFSDFKISS